MYKVLYLKWITNKDLLYTTGNSAQCYMAAWMGRVSRRMDTSVCVAEPLSCPPETISTLLITCVRARVRVRSPPGSSVHGILQVRIPEWVGLLAILQHKIKVLKKGT